MSSEGGVSTVSGAERSRWAASDCGVPESRLQLEPGDTSTYESAAGGGGGDRWSHYRPQLEPGDISTYESAAGGTDGHTTDCSWSPATPPRTSRLPGGGGGQMVTLQTAAGARRHLHVRVGCRGDRWSHYRLQLEPGDISTYESAAGGTDGHTTDCSWSPATPPRTSRLPGRQMVTLQTAAGARRHLHVRVGCRGGGGGTDGHTTDCSWSPATPPRTSRLPGGGGDRWSHYRLQLEPGDTSTYESAAGGTDGHTTDCSWSPATPPRTSRLPGRQMVTLQTAAGARRHLHVRVGCRGGGDRWSHYRLQLEPGDTSTYESAAGGGGGTDGHTTDCSWSPATPPRTSRLPGGGGQMVTLQTAAGARRHLHVRVGCRGGGQMVTLQTAAGVRRHLHVRVSCRGGGGGRQS